MSRPRRSGEALRRRAQATVFAALGDETRLALLARLYDGRRRSIAELTEGLKLTRQAITKHLRVLERARVVHSARAGREKLFEFDPQPMEELKQFLEVVSRQWDEALLRLQAFMEE